ncbi:MAG: arylsulfatase A-like enzyme [Planctomycetota bacterium]|jgi:arylsulfatase A-like enzyme
MGLSVCLHRFVEGLRAPILCLLVLQPAQGALTGVQESSEQPPNLVVFLVDDLGWQDTSLAFGVSGERPQAHFRTPNLERLAREGMSLTQGYASAPVCTPTRTSLMTGMSPARSRITYWTLRKDKDNSSKHPNLQAPPWRVNGLRAGETTLPALLSAAGYRTIHVGKSHLGALETAAADPRALGFEVNIAGHAAGAPGSYYGVHQFRSEARKGKPGRTVWDVPGLEPYHDQEVFLTEALSIEACRAVRDSVQAKQPFYLQFNPYAVHTPIMSNAKYLAKYAGMDAREAAYASMVEGVDQALGALLATLEKEGVADNTLVVFTSDNGGMSALARGGERHTHNAPLRSGKGAAYEGGVRVPWVVRWPGIVEAGSTRAEPVVTQDLFPTLLAAAGVGVPAEHAPKLDGIDLGPLMRGEHFAAVRPLVWHQPHFWGPTGPGIEPYTALRLGHEKLIWFHDGMRLELYDLEQDVGEAHDLAAAQPERVDALAAVLGEWMRERKVQRSLLKTSGVPVPWLDQ